MKLISFHYVAKHKKSGYLLVMSHGRQAGEIGHVVCPSSASKFTLSNHISTFFKGNNINPNDYEIKTLTLILMEDDI